MAGTGNMTRKKEAAISALLTTNTVQEAAHATGIGERTLWRWLQDETFQEHYRAARREVVSQAVARLQQACTQAVQALAAVINDTESTAAARVSAAKTILEYAFKSVELEEIEVRLSEIEQVVENQEKGGAGYHVR